MGEACTKQLQKSCHPPFFHSCPVVGRPAHPDEHPPAPPTLSVAGTGVLPTLPSHSATPPLLPRPRERAHRVLLLVRGGSRWDPCRVRPSPTAGRVITTTPPRPCASCERRRRLPGSSAFSFFVARRRAAGEGDVVPMGRKTVRPRRASDGRAPAVGHDVLVRSVRRVAAGATAAGGGEMGCD